MLFMTVYTYEPENRDAIQKRRIEKGAMLPQAFKMLGEWSSLAGHQVFRLFEGDDPKGFLAGAMAWTDLGKLEAYPVIPTEEMIQLIAGKK